MIDFYIYIYILRLYDQESFYGKKTIKKTVGMEILCASHSRASTRMYVYVVCTITNAQIKTNIYMKSVTASGAQSMLVVVIKIDCHVTFVLMSM